MNVRIVVLSDEWYAVSSSITSPYGLVLQHTCVAPGAWIAFRVSSSDIADYNNVTDYSQRMAVDTSASGGFAGMDARVDGTPVPVVANRTYTPSKMLPLVPYLAI